MTSTQASTTPTTQTTDTKKTEVKEKVIDKNRVYVGNLSYRTTSEELKAYFLTVCPGVTAAEVISYPNGRSKGCGLVEFKTAGDAEKAIKELNNTELASRKIYIREDREAKGFIGGGGGTKVGTAVKKSNTNNNNSNNNNTNNSNGNNTNGSNNRRNDQGQERRNYNYTNNNNNNNRSYDNNNNNHRNYQPRDREQKQQAPRTKNTDGSNLYVGNLPYSTQDSDLKSLFEEHGEVAKAEVVLDRNGRSKGFGMVKMASVTDADAAITGLNEQTYQNRKLVVRVDNYA